MIAPSTFARHLLLLSAITAAAGCSRPTPAPSATPSAVVEVAETGYLDDFSDPSSGWRLAWPLLLDAPHGAEYSDGAYRIWIDNDQGAYDVVVASSGRTFDDVSMQVDVRRVEGEPYAGAFLICRLDVVSGSFYSFKLDGERVVSIGFYLDGEEQRTVFKEVPAELLEAEPIRFGASCIGSTLSISVGGETIFELEEASLTSGQIGLGAGEGEVGRTEMLFDNFAAQAPEDAARVASGGDGDGTETEDWGEGELFPFAGGPPAPDGLIDAIAERVAQGDWTQEQALIINLKLLAGEVPLGEVYAVPPESLEGFGLVLEASRYLAGGSDAAARAEIERLLSILLPERERLMEVASPEASALSRPAGLAAPAAMQIDCEQLYKKGFPPGSGIKCLLYKQSGIGGFQVTTFYPLASLPLEYADAAHEAVLKSWTTFSGLKGGLSSTTMGNVDLVFVLLPAVEGSGILALVPSKAPEPTCKITVFLGAIQANEKTKSGPGDFGYFQQTIAHEVFHCYQQWNFPEHFPNLSAGSNWAVQDWWGEGTAEYFSNVVYPTVNAEWGRAKGFNEKSAYRSLIEQSYGNTFFFQYLAGLVGNEILLQRLHTLPPYGDEANQLQALSTWPGIDQHFHDFGRAFFEGTIKDTSGSLVPSAPPVVLDEDFITVPESQVRLLEARPFVLKRVGVLFPQGHRYTLAAVTQGGLPGLEAVRRGWSLGGAWGDWPASVATGCKQAFFLALMTSTASSSGAFAVQLSINREQPVVCDSCLPGKWMLQHDSLAEYLEAPFDESPGFFTFNSGGGLWIYRFTSTGGLDAAIHYAFGYELKQGSETLPLLTQVVMTIAGKGLGAYWVAYPGTLEIERQDSNIKMEQTIMINGQLAAADSPIPFHPFPEGTALVGYGCNGNTLMLSFEGAQQAGMPPLEFERIESAP